MSLELPTPESPVAFPELEELALISAESVRATIDAQVQRTGHPWDEGANRILANLPGWPRELTERLYAERDISEGLDTVCQALSLAVNMSSLLLRPTPWMIDVTQIDHVNELYPRSATLRYMQLARRPALAGLMNRYIRYIPSAEGDLFLGRWAIGITFRQIDDYRRDLQAFQTEADLVSTGIVWDVSQFE